MGKAKGDDLSDIKAVEREVDELRERTQALLEELERRVRDGVERVQGTVERVRHAIDIPAHLQAVPRAIRKHPRTSAGIGLGTLVVAGLGIWWAIARRRRARRPWNRFRARMGAYGAILARPHELVPVKPSLLKRLLTAALVAGATALARNGLAFAMHRAAQRRQLPPSVPLGV